MTLKTLATQDELDALRVRVTALERIILDAGLWRKAPCCLCGYNGPGYYQPATHRCAALAAAKRKF